MHAEEVHKFRDVVRAERSVANLFAAGSHDDRVQLVVLPDTVNDQPCPVDRHRVSRRPATHNPERRLVSKVPPDNRALIGIVAAELGGKVSFQAQHVGIRVWMPTMSPRHVPVRLPNFSANEQAWVKIDLVLVRE